MKHPVPVPAPPAVPRLGPPTNLRPAGPHADRRRETRAAAKAALKKAAFDVLRGASGRRSSPFREKRRSRGGASLRFTLRRDVATLPASG